MKKWFLCVWMVLIFSVGQANATSLSSVVGSFAIGDEVEFIGFEVISLSNVTLRTSSYATGGFDPVLTLFDSGGSFIADNDEGIGVDSDPNTGLASDALLTAVLSAGDYKVALSQFPNFYIQQSPPDLSDFLSVLFPGTIQGFLDAKENERTGDWALQILVDPITVSVPEPASIALLSLGLAGLGFIRKKRRA